MTLVAIVAWMGRVTRTLAWPRRCWSRSCRMPFGTIFMPEGTQWSRSTAWADAVRSPSGCLGRRRDRQRPELARAAPPGLPAV